MGLCLSTVDKTYEVYSGVQRAEKVPLPSWLGLHSLDKGSSIDRFSDLTYIARDRDCEIFAGCHSSGKRWYALRRYHKQRVYEKKLLPSIQHEIDVFLNLDGLRGFATTVCVLGRPAPACPGEAVVVRDSSLWCREIWGRGGNGVGAGWGYKDVRPTTV